MPKNKFKKDSSKLPTDKNAHLVSKGEYVLVDIKEPREFNEVHNPTDYRKKRLLSIAIKKFGTI